MKKDKVSAKKNSHTNSAFFNPQTGRISITDAFGESLADLLAQKIVEVYKDFPRKSFCASVQQEVIGKSYTQRVEIIANNLKKCLPQYYPAALKILMSILGPENPHETGMFTNFYWIMPIGKFVEKYGLDHFKLSIGAIEEITKRNTGEYAIRPYARKYPKEVLVVCTRWAQSDNFHLRRLATEGLRPKLPWATKLDVWNNDPTPIFVLLELFKEDTVKFVKKSVANHVRDWLKVNPMEGKKLIEKWSKSKNEHTQWILKYAQR